MQKWWTYLRIIKSLDKKSSFVDIYTHIRPQPYYNHCDKLHYGKSHNGFNKFTTEILNDYINKMNIVGSSSSMNGNGMNVWYNCIEYPIFPMCIYYE